MISEKILNKIGDFTKAKIQKSLYSEWNELNRSIFVHVPKDGGNSIATALGIIVSKHTIAAQYKFSSGSKFEEYFKFDFLRNHDSRLISTYYFLLKGGINNYDEDFSTNKIIPYGNLDHFVNLGLANDPIIQDWIQFVPQSKFLSDLNGKILVDFIGKFENLYIDFKHISNTLKIISNLPHLNQGVFQSENSKLSPAAIRVVNDFYASDFQLFCYTSAP